MRSSWVSQVDPKSNSKYPRKRRGEDAEGRCSCEDGSTGWNDAATSQESPEAIRDWKRWGRILSQSLWRECYPANALISDFCPAQMWKNKFLVLLTIIFLKILSISLFLAIAVCGLSLVVASSSCSPVEVHRLFIVIASLAARHGL